MSTLVIAYDSKEKNNFQIGAHIRRVTADQIKKVSLELGGKNPAIVFGDADIDKGKDITRLALDTSVLIQKSFFSDQSLTDERLKRTVRGNNCANL